jgi:hypothetical protein
MDAILEIPDAGDARPAGASDLTQVTRGERLFLWRMSQASSNPTLGSAQMSQTEAADTLGLRIKVYQAAERDIGEPPRAVVAFLARAWPQITTAQRCRLARHRSGLTLDAVAFAAGPMSRPTYLRYEGLGDPRLVAWWETRGFRFAS